MSYQIYECVVCGRNIIWEPNHRCTPTAIRRYEKKMRAAEREPSEASDALSEGLEVLEKLSKE